MPPSPRLYKDTDSYKGRTKLLFHVAAIKWHWTQQRFSKYEQPPIFAQFPSKLF